MTTDDPMRTSANGLVISTVSIFARCRSNCSFTWFYVPSDSLTFDDFCDICRKEAVTTEDEIIKAFRRIDINGDGFISNSELRKMLTTVSFCARSNVVSTPEAWVCGCFMQRADA
jgi:hypothetical protein